MPVITGDSLSAMYKYQAVWLFLVIKIAARIPMTKHSVNWTTITILKTWAVVVGSG